MCAILHRMMGDAMHPSTPQLSIVNQESYDGKVDSNYIEDQTIINIVSASRHVVYPRERDMERTVRRTFIPSLLT